MSDNLYGKVIVVTRAAKQAGQFIQALRGAGADVVHIPTIKITEPESWVECDRALQQIAVYDWLIFTSVNGVTFFQKRAEQVNVKLTGHGFKIAVVGEHTANFLLDRGFRVSLIPERFNAEALINSFAKMKVEGSRILIPTVQSNGAFPSNKLKTLGAIVDMVPVYKNENESEIGTSQLQRLNEQTPDVITFTSPSTFENFIFLVGEAQFEKWVKSGSKIATLGPVTADAVRKAGYVSAIEPAKATIPALVATISDYFDVN